MPRAAKDMQPTNKSIRTRQRSSLRNEEKYTQRKVLMGKTSRRPRPRTTVLYDLPKKWSQLDDKAPVQDQGQSSNSRITSRKPAQKQLVPSEQPIAPLGRVKILLDLLHRRNKNQHRNQPFFKWLNLLRRAISKLLEVHLAHHNTESDTKTVTSRPGPGCADSSKLISSKSDNPFGTADQVRRRLEREAELRSQRELQESWITETLIPAAYVAFTSLIADSQFANLGIVLTGVLSDIASIVGVPKRIERLRAPRARRSLSDNVTNAGFKGTTLTGKSTIVTGPDVGEVVERTYDNSVDGVNITMDLDDVGHMGHVINESQTYEQSEESVGPAKQQWQQQPIVACTSTTSVAKNPAGNDIEGIQSADTVMPRKGTPKDSGLTQSKSSSSQSPSLSSHDAKKNKSSHPSFPSYKSPTALTGIIGQQPVLVLGPVPPGGQVPDKAFQPEISSSSHSSNTTKIADHPTQPHRRHHRRNSITDETNAPDANKHLVRTTDEERKNNKQKKKKRRMDAIDDLFSGF